MPEVDGFEVLQWMLERRPAQRIPIVVLTSSEHADHENRARGLGAVAFYRKPGNLDQLSEVVEGIVQEWVGRDLSSVLPSAG